MAKSVSVRSGKGIPAVSPAPSVNLQDGDLKGTVGKTGNSPNLESNSRRFEFLPDASSFPGRTTQDNGPKPARGVSVSTPVKDQGTTKPHIDFLPAGKKSFKE